MGILNYQINAAGIIKSLFYSKEEQWFEAAKTGNIKTMQKLVGKVHINAEDKLYRTALMFASLNGHENIVKLLLQIPGINVNAQYVHGDTPLRLAFENGKENILKLLLQIPGIKFQANQDNETSLVDACSSGKENIVKLLLKVPGININDQNNQSGKTALIRAASGGYENIVKLLLQVRGVNVNARDRSHGCTALMDASCHGHENVVKLLLKVPGIDVNAKTFMRGKTALVFACQEAHENVVKLLLQEPSLSINAQDDNGDTALMALMYAPLIRGRENIMKLLLQAPGINVNSRNRDGHTVLMIACQVGHENIVKLLLHVPGISINAVVHKYKSSSYNYTLEEITALKQAAAHGHSVIVRLITDKIRELISQSFEAIKHKDLDSLKVIIRQLTPQCNSVILPEYDIDTSFDVSALLEKAFFVNSHEIVLFLLQNAKKDPRELLASFPFEVISPTSDFFKYFVNLAFGHSFEKEIESEFSEAQTSKSVQNKSCLVCLKNTNTMCSGCKKVYYCSALCQKSDWSKHKPKCRLASAD